MRFSDTEHLLNHHSLLLTHRRSLALSSPRCLYIRDGVVKIGDTYERKFVFTREMVNRYKIMYGDDEDQSVTEEEEIVVPLGALFW